jgi:glycosyltransferase involved in cell wall biosynthesis
VKASVCLIAHRHEAYIADAIEHALAQLYEDEWEVVIGVDRSADATFDIATEYASRHPRIRLLPEGDGLGLVPNFFRTYNSTTGEYIALLDGDDYWTDPRKLAKQAVFLDANPTCTVCFHDVDVMLEDGTMCGQRYTGAGHPPFSAIGDLFATNFIATCSAMLRRSARPELPSWYPESLFEDWPLYILFAERGGIGYLNEAMAVYRHHGRGLWSGLTPEARASRTIEFLRWIKGRLDARYGPEIERSIVRHLEREHSRVDAPGGPGTHG